MLKKFFILLGIMLVLAGCASDSGEASLKVPEDAVARVLYFYAEDCTLCMELYADVLEPLVNRCGDSLELKSIQVNVPEGYEVFIAAEQALIGDAGRWDIPTIVVDDTYFIGEDAIRNSFLPYLQCVFGDGGNAWPDLPSLQSYENGNQLAAGSSPFTGMEEGVEECISEEELAVCASPNPIFALYFASVDCEEACDRTIYDLRYLQGFYPQLFFEQKAIEDNVKLARALADSMNVTVADDQLAPALIVGTHYIYGEALTLDNLKSVIGSYTETGALAVWYTLDVE